jgi:hypothetical protein
MACDIPGFKRGGIEIRPCYNRSPREKMELAKVTYHKKKTRAKKSWNRISAYKAIDPSLAGVFISRK